MLGAGLRPRIAMVEPIAHVPAPPSTNLALLPIRVFLGLGWTRAGVEKLISAEWWNGDALSVYLVQQRPRMLAPALPIVDGLFAPTAAGTSMLVIVLQLAVGVALLSGVRVRLALWAGVAMNVTFIVLGTVNPSAFYLVMELALLLGLELHRDNQIADHARAAAGRAARTAGTVMAVATLPLVPLVTTLHPAEVIDDPAIMLITLGLLTAGSQLLRWTRLVRRDDPVTTAPIREWPG